MFELHHPSIHDYSTAVPSFWEASGGPPVGGAEPLSGDRRTEIAIIGAGVTGLNAALSLARDHGREVVVLDAGAIGWGASGRNGGFCCLGSHKLGWPALIKRFGRDEARRFFATQVEAIEHVRDLITDEAIDADLGPSGEVLIAHHPRAVSGLIGYGELLADTFGVACEWLPQAALRERGFVTAEAQGALMMPIGFPLHPLKYLRGLARLAQRHGAELHGRSEVVEWRREDGRECLRTAGGAVLRAERVVVATAGFTRDRLHPGFAGRLLPVLTNIVTTRPLSESERAAQGWTSQLAAADSRKLLHYFRLLPDGRMMFGARGGLSAGPRSTAAMQAKLRRDFDRFFPAWQGVEFTHYWRGLTDLAADLLPHLGSLDAGRIHYALAWHGSGVAMGSWCGRALAERLAGNAAPAPSPLTQPLRRFPVPALRPAYLAAIYAAAGITDRFGL